MYSLLILFLQKDFTNPASYPLTEETKKLMKVTLSNKMQLMLPVLVTD